MTNVQLLVNALFTNLTEATDQNAILEALNELNAVNEIVYLLKAGYIDTAKYEILKLHFDTMDALLSTLALDGMEMSI